MRGAVVIVIANMNPTLRIAPEMMGNEQVHLDLSRMGKKSGDVRGT